jgi:hypothetical protein
VGTAITLKMTVFWGAVLYILVEVYWCFRGAYCLHHQGNEWQMMEALSISGLLVNFYQTTFCNIPEDSHLNTCCHENLKSHLPSLYKNNYFAHWLFSFKSHSCAFVFIDDIFILNCSPKWCRTQSEFLRFLSDNLILGT